MPHNAHRCMSASREFQNHVAQLIAGIQALLSKKDTLKRERSFLLDIRYYVRYGTTMEVDFFKQYFFKN